MTGEPLAGAEARVTSSGGGTFTALSGADGMLEITGIPAGPFSIAVSKVGFFPLRYGVSDTGAVEVRVTPALRTVPSDVSVVATIENPTTRAPEPGVRVTLLGPNSRVISDAQGRLQYDHVAPGRHSLRLEKQGYADAIGVFDALVREDGGPTVLTIPYPTAAGFGRFTAVSPGDTAHVRDRFSGRGIAGATITVEGQTIVADQDGAFTIPALSEADPHDLVASAGSYQPETQRIVIAPGGNEKVEFGLLSEVRGAVSGTVRDAATQAGISMATVQVAGSADQITHTNSDGSYLLDGVTPGTYPLEVTHPAYLAATTSAVTVVSEAEAHADAALTHRPTVGGLEGRVLDADTGAAIVGAVVSHGGLSTTSDALGRYSLAGLPAGMTAIDLAAPGYPATTRDVAIVADRDTATPTSVVRDLLIRNDGTGDPDMPVEIGLLTGGRVSDPTGRLTVILPSLSISEDARVTVRISSPPEVISGESLPLDPSLNAPVARAVGPEMTIRLEPLEPGGRIPRPVGPWILIQRYSAADAEAAGVTQDLLVPFVWNGLQFTAFETLPYVHAVDAVDRVVVIAIDPSTTESGAPVFAGMIGKSLPLYAATTGPQPTQSEFDLTVQLGAPAQSPPPVEPAPFSAVIDLRDNSNLDIPSSKPHPNSYPLLVIHGWEPRRFWRDNEPVANPFDSEGGDPRSAQMLRDVVSSVAGIYRPVWVTYNSRARAAATAGTVYSNLKGKLANVIRGIPADPNDPSSGRFSSVDLFGFSKGGFVGRSLLCQPEIDVLGAVLLATPHHGALNRLTPLLDLPWYIADPIAPQPPPPDEELPTIRRLLEEIAPGTAELLDYADGAAPVDSGNPYLARLNRSPCSASAQTMSLLAGSDPYGKRVELVLPPMGRPSMGYLDGMELQQLLPPGLAESIAGLPPQERETALQIFFNLGAFAAGNPSDGIVPVWSAQGLDRNGIRVPAFFGVGPGGLVVPEPVALNHPNMGSAAQPLADVLPDHILPTLTAWYTTTQVGSPQEAVDATGKPTYAVPTRVEWLSTRSRTFTGFTQVL